MKYIFVIITVLFANVSVYAAEKQVDLEKKEKEAIKKAMEKEKKFAKEQKFYQGKDYDLKSEEIDPAVIDAIPYQEPENDFDMSEGVYD